jgi:predicted aspartyl protease
MQHWRDSVTVAGNLQGSKERVAIAPKSSRLCGRMNCFEQQLSTDGCTLQGTHFRWGSRGRSPSQRALGALMVFVGVCVACAQSNQPLARVPVSVSRGLALIPARVNGSEPLNFLLDTGFSMTMVRTTLSDSLQLERAGEITVVGIAGEERVPTFDNAIFDIGGARYAPRRVGGMAATRRKRDGIIGAGLFRQYVVDLDMPRKELRLHEPKAFVYQGKGEAIPLRFRRSSAIMELVIETTNGSSKGAFEIDTGCDSGICIGHDFASRNKLLGVTETEKGTKVGVGGDAKTQSGHLPRVQIGSLKIERPQTDFFLEGSPVDAPHAGHIGMGVLKDFRIIFDYSRQQMILER